MAATARTGDGSKGACGGYMPPPVRPISTRIHFPIFSKAAGSISSLCLISNFELMNEKRRDLISVELRSSQAKYICQQGDTNCILPIFHFFHVLPAELNKCIRRIIIVEMSSL